MQSGDNPDSREGTAHGSAIKAKFTENRGCFSDGEEDSSPVSRPRIVLVRSHSRDQSPGSPQIYTSQRYEMPISRGTPKHIAMPTIGEPEGQQSRRVFISPLIYSTGKQPHHFVIKSGGQRSTLESPQPRGQSQRTEFYHETPPQKLIYTSPMAHKYSTLSRSKYTEDDNTCTKIPYSRTTGTPTMERYLFEHPKSSETPTRKASESFSSKTPITLTSTSEIPWKLVNCGHKSVSGGDLPEFSTERAATVEASPYPWRKSSDSVLQYNYQDKKLDDSCNQPILKPSIESSTMQHVDRSVTEGAQFEGNEQGETPNYSRNLPVQVYRIRNVDYDASPSGRIMLIRQRSVESPQRLISVDSSQTGSPQDTRMYRQQMEFDPNQGAPKTSVVKKFVNVIADRMVEPQRKMYTKGPGISSNVYSWKDQPRAMRASTDEESYIVDKKSDKIPKQRSFDSMETQVENSSEPENKKTKRNIFNNFHIIFGSCGDVNSSSGDKEGSVYFQDFDDLVQRINQARLKVDQRSPKLSDPVITTSDCRYTCHQPCRKLVTLDCASTTDGTAKQEPLPSTYETCLTNKSEDDADSGYHTGEYSVEKQGLKLSGQQFRPPGHFTLTREDLRRNIEAFNNNNYGLIVSLQQDSLTFQGFIRVHMNLIRPISMSLSVRPPSIYDVLTHDEPEPCTRGPDSEIASFYLPKDTTKVIHIASDTTTQEVIRTLLGKFKITDNPRKFALYEKAEEKKKVIMRRMSDDEQPLPLCLSWGAEGLHTSRFVLQENDPGEIIWDAFSVPELDNFLRILNKEEEEYVDQIKAKYQLMEIHIHKKLEEMEAARQKKHVEGAKACLGSAIQHNMSKQLVNSQDNRTPPRLNKLDMTQTLESPTAGSGVSELNSYKERSPPADQIDKDEREPVFV